MTRLVFTCCAPAPDDLGPGDGTLAPCFPMYNAYFDWGTIEHHRFEARQLNEMKTECNSHCCSTLNYLLGYCYDDARVRKIVPLPRDAFIVMIVAAGRRADDGLYHRQFRFERERFIHEV